MIEKIINKVLAQVIELPADILQRLQAVMLYELSQYEITPKSTDLVPYTGDPQILKLFLASKKVDGVSINTIKSYTLVLTNFLARLQKDPLKVTTVEIRMYLALRESEGLSKGSLATLLSILKSFYQWLENEELILKSPCRKIKNIKTESHKTYHGNKCG